METTNLPKLVYFGLTPSQLETLFGSARILKGSFTLSLADGLCGGAQIGIINKFPKAAQPGYSPISRPFWVRIGVRVRVRVRARARDRGWVGSTPVPRSDQEVLSGSQKRTAHRPKDPGRQLVR